MTTPTPAIRRVSAVLATLTVFFAASADAQVYDHQTCFKIKDSQKTNGRLDLTVVDPVFQPPEECKVVGKAKFYCLPTDKSVLELEVDNAPAATLPVTGPEPIPHRICYKLKCPRVDLSPALISDQFGSRDLSKFKAKLFCTPAVQGPPSTCGNGIVEGDEVCDDGNTVGGDCCDAVCGVAALDGTSCDDGDPCTVPDQCFSGSCVSNELSDPYEPNDTFAQANARSPVDDDDSYPAFTLPLRLYGASDAADWFSYAIDDVIFGTFDPRADLTVSGGEDYELFLGYLCDAGTETYTCGAGTTPCNADGLPGCCISGTGTVRFASFTCTGAGDNDGVAYVRVVRNSGAPTCDVYMLRGGDD